MKEINISKQLEILIKVLIVLSFAVLSLILMHDFKLKIAVINGILCLIVGVLVFKKISIKKITIKKLIISLLIAAYVDTLFITISQTRMIDIITTINLYINRGFINQIIPYLIGVLSYPAIVFCIYYWIEKHHPKVIQEVKSLEKKEINYLIIVGILSLLLVTFTFTFSTAFLNTTYEDRAITDVIYTSDNGTIYGTDAWFNIPHPENDIRQPLFGIFSLPFSIPAHITSELIFFVPKDACYGVVLSVIQFLLLALTTIMLARILKLKDYQKKYFYAFFSLSFPYIIFGLLIEQYVVALFYLILTIYEYDKLKGINYSYLGSVSTLITSGIIFPLITKFKDLKTTIKNYKDCFIYFIVVLVLGGQFSQILTINEKMTYFMSDFAGKQSLPEKFCKYTTFVESIFKITPGHIEKFLNYDAYRLPIPETISIIGIVILALVVLSFILNRKEKMAWISILWIIFSIIILCIVGWGTVENGLILYSLYFAWAFYLLIYLLIKKLIPNKKLFSSIMIILIVVMFIYNSKEILNILDFALTYYRR